MAALTDSSKKCIFVVGPTASGKSAWALRAAEKFKGSIVNIDSVQFYEGLVVGAAAPTREEKKLVPHHLYSYVKPPVEMTAGMYLRDFYDLLKTDVQFPLFIVGGTGFYIQALEKGMYDVAPVPADVRLAIEAELQERGAEALHRELMSKDPGSKIHMNDHFRLVRALEILRHTGKIPSELNQSSEKNKDELPFDFMKIGFDFEKSAYEGRIKSRTEKMIAGGIIEETSAVLQASFAEWAPLRSVGYRETVEFLTRGETRDWLQAAIVQSTMQLIKKQKTWFKRDKAILWSNNGEMNAVTLEEKLDRFLS